MSSEASSTPAKTKLVSIRHLFGQTFRLYGKFRGLFLGYAGWLLLPTAAHVITRVTLGNVALADNIDGLISAVVIALSIWVVNSVALSAEALHTHGDEPTARAHVASRAQKKLLIVFLLQVAVSLLSLAGAIVLIIPGIIAGTWFTLAPIVALFEDVPKRGPLRSILPYLSRSRQLVGGKFMPVFWRLLSLNALLALLYGGLLVLMATVGQVDFASQTIAIPLPYDIALNLLEVLLLPVIVIYQTFLYLSLKNS